MYEIKQKQSLPTGYLFTTECSKGVGFDVLVFVPSNSTIYTKINNYENKISRKINN
jgi:hypothetical protein